MEKQLKCVLVLRLKEMSLRKVAALLLTGPDIVAAAISKFRIPDFAPKGMKEWFEIIEIKIKGEMLELELPALLEQQVIDKVKPLSLQILRWKSSQEDYLSSRNEVIRLPDSAKLFWTSTGTIDYRKTAESLVRSDALDVVQRYQLACFNCLEEDIPSLWKKLPEEKKFYFYNKVLYRNPTSPCLPFCWPHIVAGELSPLDCLLRRPDRHLSSFNQWAFERSVENGNTVAVEHFFRKLTYAEREASLTRTVVASLRSTFRIQSKYLSRFRFQKLSDVSCHLLASMNPAEQMEIFRLHPGEVLLAFLDCPWPDLFLENVGLMWDRLPPSGYGDLLRNMENRFTYTNPYFPELFREFFVQSPLDCKKCFIDGNSESETPASLILWRFFELEDSKSVEVIFRNIDASDRMRIVLSEVFLRMFHFYMLGGWNMVEVCVREATQSKADRKRLKETFIKFLEIRRGGWEYQRFKRFFDFLDEAVVSGDQGKKAQKRKLENCCL